MSASRRHRARWPPRPTGGACEATSIPSCSRPCERILPGGIRRWKRCWMMSPVIAPACRVRRAGLDRLSDPQVHRPPPRRRTGLGGRAAGPDRGARRHNLEVAGSIAGSRKETEGSRRSWWPSSGSPIRSPWLPDGRSPRPSCWNKGARASGRSIRPWRHDRRFRPSCSTWSASSTAISGSISEPSPCSVARYNFPRTVYGDDRSIVAARSTDLASALLEQGRYARRNHS